MVPEREMAEEKTWLESLFRRGDRDVRRLRRELKELLWFKAGIIRTGTELEEALGKVHELTSYLSRARIGDSRGLLRYLELRNMLFISEAVCRAALMRTETRGAHYRSDYPEEDNDNWLKNILVRKKGAGMSLETAPVPTVALAL